MKISAPFLAVAILFPILFPGAGAIAADGFDIVSLGSLGGIQDGNLSANLIRPHGDERAVTCDAGTLVNGLRVAGEAGGLDRIKGYLISHAHLDHVAGLVIASPDDGKKPIYALPSVNAALADTYFNWVAWPNFTDRGKAPQLKKYALQDLKPGVATALQDTSMSVTAFPLSHGGVESTAFVIESDGDAVLCFGDTGPDPVEKTTRLHDVWAAVADKVRQHRLKAILIESSYTSDRPDNQLFGHLTPKWVLSSLRELDGLAGGKAVEGLPVVITHIKYVLTGDQPQKKMLGELTAGNDLGVRFIVPAQGDRWHFK
jgi:3',5'-cyclic-nucleotide phosphodiesterase